MPQSGMILENLSGLSWVTRLLDILVIFGAQFAAHQVYAVRWDAYQSLAFATTLMLFGLVAEYYGLYRARPGERLSGEVAQLAAIISE